MVGDNSFDLVVGTILLLIILFSFLKGFARDFSSTLCWFSAALISYFFGPVLFNIFKIHIGNAYLAKVSSYSILFIITLIIIYILISKLLRPLLSKIPDVIDRSLGLFFGVFKGYVMLCLVFGVFVKISNSHIFSYLSKTKKTSGGDTMNWFSNAKSYPILEFGASKLSFLFDHISLDFLERSSDSNIEIKDPDGNKFMDDNFDKGLESGSKKLSINKNAVKSGGYKSNEIRKMDRLIYVIDNINDNSSEDGADKSSVIELLIPGL